MKKIKVKFVDFGTQFAFQILEQEGFPEEHNEGNVRILYFPEYNRSTDIFFLRGYCSHLDMNVVLNTYKDGEDFQKIIDHFLDALRNFLTAIEIHDALPGDDVTIKTVGGYFISRKLIALLPEDYKNRYIVDIGDGNTIAVDKVYANCKPLLEQKIETYEESGVVIITLTQQD